MAFAKRLCLFCVGLVFSLLYTSSKCADPENTTDVESKVGLISLLKVFKELPLEDLQLISSHIDDVDPGAFEGVLSVLATDHEKLTPDLITAAIQHMNFIKGLLEASKLLSKTEPVTTAALITEPTTPVTLPSIDEQEALFEDLTFELIDLPLAELQAIINALDSRDEFELKRVLVNIGKNFPQVTEDMIRKAMDDTLTLRSVVEKFKEVASVETEEESTKTPLKPKDPLVAKKLEASQTMADVLTELDKEHEGDKSGAQDNDGRDGTQVKGGLGGDKSSKDNDANIFNENSEEGLFLEPSDTPVEHDGGDKESDEHDGGDKESDEHDGGDKESNEHDGGDKEHVGGNKESDKPDGGDKEKSVDKVTTAIPSGGFLGAWHFLLIFLVIAGLVGTGYICTVNRKKVREGLQGYIADTRSRGRGSRSYKYKPVNTA